MADLKLSDLVAANVVQSADIFYVVQNGVSKKISAKDMFGSIINPTFKGNIFLDTNKQVLTESNAHIFPITNNRLITDFVLTNGVIYPRLSNGIENGQLKVITLRSTVNGSAVLTGANANIIGGTVLEFARVGDTALLLYESNAWRILGTSPGFKSNISGYTEYLDELPGTSKKFFTNTRARSAISAGDVTIIYDEANGTIKANVSYLANLDLQTFSTDDLPEGTANLYFTNTRAVTAVANTIAQLRSEVLHPVANVIYVKTNGNDALDGRTLANALANIHTALGRANAWETVQVSSGEYILYNNPVTIPARVGLVGDNLRTTTVYPQTNTQDMFYVENASYVTGFTFRGHISPASVFAFNPNGSAGTIVTSPYIQNCSSITTTGTGMRVDGSVVGGLRSMVCDSYTQTNAGGIGIHMLNRGYTQLVSVFTICCSVAILCEAGGFCSITNSNSSFGTYGLKADGVSEPLYYGKIKSQVNSRTFVMKDLTKRPSVGDAILIANYNQSKCSRDTGLIVDSLAFDLAYSGNTQATFAGLQYYAQSSSAIPGQAEETVAALNFAKNLANVVSRSIGPSVRYQSNVVQFYANASPGNTYTANIVDTGFNLIVDIIQNGTVGVTDRIIPNSYPANTNATINHAANLLQQNKEFIAAETVGYVNTTYPSFSYDTTTCARDVGYIVDSLTFDLKHGGNKQAVQSGVYYYNFNANVSQINNQVVQTGAAYTYIKNIVQDILTNTEIVNPLQTTVSQNTTAAAAATFSQINSINNNIDLIVDIIQDGPAQAGPKRPIGLAANTNVNTINATKILLANKDFIKAEVLEYVNRNWALISNGAIQFYTVNSSTELTNVVGGYDQAKCARDVGYIANAVLIDAITKSNYRSTIAGMAYLRSYSSNVLGIQKEPTLAGIAKSRDLILDYVSNAQMRSIITERYSNVINIINVGANAIGNVFVTSPSTISSGFANAVVILNANKEFIKDEIVSWIAVNEPNIAASYDAVKCARDIGYVIDAFKYDLTYDCNSQSTEAANAYWRGAVSVLPSNQRLPTANSFGRLRDIVSNVVLNIAITRSANANVSLTQNTSLPVGSAAASSNLIVLSNIIIDFIPDGDYDSAYTYKDVALTTPPYDSNFISEKNTVDTNISGIKTSVINYINVTFPNLGGIGESTVVFDEKLLTTEYPAANSTVSFHQRSYISASSHTFEYVGSGNELATALPYAGGIPIQENEVIESRGGAVYYTSTDHVGDFRIGNELLINRASGTIVGRTFDKSLFAVLTPYILAIQ